MIVRKSERPDAGWVCPLILSDKRPDNLRNSFVFWPEDVDQVSGCSKVIVRALCLKRILARKGLLILRNEVADVRARSGLNGFCNALWVARWAMMHFSPTVTPRMGN